MVYIQKHSLGSFLGDMKGNLGRPHFFPWGQFARHSKKNVSSQRASAKWPDIQLMLICSGEQHAAGQYQFVQQVMGMAAMRWER